MNRSNFLFCKKCSAGNLINPDGKFFCKDCEKAKLNQINKKICNECGESKGADFFPKNSLKCKTCKANRSIKNGKKPAKKAIDYWANTSR